MDYRQPTENYPLKKKIDASNKEIRHIADDLDINYSKLLRLKRGEIVADYETAQKIIYWCKENLNKENYDNPWYEKDGKYICRQCGAGASSAGHIKSHISVVHGP